MITLYTWKTPNGRKISIMLEELGLPYRVVPVDIGKDEQFKADFLAIAPNNKIPAIVDDDTGEGEIALFESGAILVYLAEKTGRLLPSSIKGRASTLSWLNWQMGGLGPMLGQLNFFAVRSKEKAPLAI
jgi:GST-like protein